MRHTPVKRLIAGGATALQLALSALACFCSSSAAIAGSAEEILFEQSSLEGVDGNYIVPPAQHRPPSPGIFHLILWQPNPNRADGMLVPTAWNAGDNTGFYPSLPLYKHQAGFRDAPGASTLQIDGETVGAYINSADLPEGSHLYKMMITPEMSVAPEAQARPFGQPGHAIVVSLELQIPTAVDEHRDGSETYVVADLLFLDRGHGAKISYGCNLFFNGHPRRESGGHIRLDQDSQNMMVNSAVGMTDNTWLTTLPGSAVSQSAPWRGWKEFRFAITERNFSDALNAYKQRAGGDVSVQPADYTFAKFHLNAELHFKNSPAALGWSMRHAKIVVVDAAAVR